MLARSPVSAPLSPSVADPSGSSGSPNDTTEAKRSRITPAGIRSGPSSSVPDFGTGMLASQISLPLPSADSPTKRGLPDGVRGRVSRARWHRRWPPQREVFTRANHAPTPQWLVERVAPRETPPTGRGGALGSLPPYRMGELFDAVFCQNQSHSFQLSKSFFRFSTPKLPDGVSYTHIFDEMPFSLHICRNMDAFLVSSGRAAALILGHTLACKLLMTQLYRAPMTLRLIGANEENSKKVAGSNTFKRIAAAQLNEAEYSGVFLAALLFLSAKGIDAPLPSTLAIAGQVGYFWARALIGNSFEGGFDPPPYVPGAMMRYASMGLIAFELWKLSA